MRCRACRAPQRWNACGALLAELGNPEKDLKCIHIAGTNGKGTLAAMTASILTHAGYKTGLTISPYVLHFRERFQIDGEMIPPRTLAALTGKVLAACERLQGKRPALPGGVRGSHSHCPALVRRGEMRPCRARDRPGRAV